MVAGCVNFAASTKSIYRSDSLAKLKNHKNLGPTAFNCSLLRANVNKTVSATDAIDADHTGITVSNLDRALDFWQNVLGFEFSQRLIRPGEWPREITGVSGLKLNSPL